MTKVKITARGTIVLPKEVMDRRGFSAGTEFEVIDGGRDIVLKPVEQAYARQAELERNITIADFIAKIPRYDGPPITNSMIKEAILDEADRRWDRVSRQVDDDKND